MGNENMVRKSKKIMIIFLYIIIIFFNNKSMSYSDQEDDLTISYIVDFSESATGLSTDYSYEGIDTPKINGKEQYDVIIKRNKKIKIEDISNKYVTPINTKTVSNTKDRAVLKFVGWKVEGTNEIIKAGEEIKYEQLKKYSNSENSINLRTVWKKVENYQYVNFYINYKSQALDSEGNISGQETQNFTPSLWASYVGNATANTDYYIAGKDVDNSYEANKNIRNLKGNKGNGSIYIQDLPNDEYIINSLKKYTDKLSIDGEEIKVNDLNLEHYEVRWYVFKLQNDCWHIDGRLVRKEGKLIITKTFKGSKEAIEKVTGYSLIQNKINSNTNFNISIKGGNNSQTLNFQNYSSIINNSKEHNYELQVKWIVDIKYGINYTIQEKEYGASSYVVSEKYNIKDPEDKQSKEETSENTVKIIGTNNYVIDNPEGFEEKNAISVNFINVYDPIKLDSNTIIPETGGDGFFIQEIIGIFLVETVLIFYFRKKKGIRK